MENFEGTSNGGVGTCEEQEAFEEEVENGKFASSITTL